MPKCTFCGINIKKGTGKLFVYTSGKTANFCSNKCEKNLLKLKRKPMKTRWTQEWIKENKKATEKKEAKVEEKPVAEKPAKEEPTVEQPAKEEKAEEKPAKEAKPEAKQEAKPTEETKGEEAK